MALFKKKEENVLGLLGVDIGAGGIKVVELTPKDGRLSLSTYGYSEMKDPEKWDGSLLDDTKKGAEVLKKILLDAGMKVRRANASLPSHAVFHAIITIPQPKTADEDLRPAIESQVRKLLPIPLEQMILDTTVIDKHLLPKKEVKKLEKTGPAKADEKTGTDNKIDLSSELPKQTVSGKHIRILVSGAPKKLVAKYVALFKEVGVELASLETEAFALIRSLIGKDKTRMMIVDIGYARTNISVVHEGIPFLHRSIKAGGLGVTTVLAKQMGISTEEAEQTKIDLAVTGEAELPQVLKDAMKPILHEIKYSLELFGQQSTQGSERVEKIIITGGSSNLPQIDKYFSKELDMNVYSGDPWARIVVPDGLKPVLDEIGARFSVAIGLAMKDGNK